MTDSNLELIGKVGFLADMSEGFIYAYLTPSSAVHLGVGSKDDGDADLLISIEECEKLIALLQTTVAAAKQKASE